MWIIVRFVVSSSLLVAIIVCYCFRYLLESFVILCYREFGIVRQPAIIGLCTVIVRQLRKIPPCVLEVEGTNRLQPPVSVPVQEGRKLAEAEPVGVKGSRRVSPLSS